MTSSSLIDISPNERKLAERVDPAITSALAISDRAGGVQFVNASEVMEFAKLMALAGIGVRKHLRGNPGACLAICVQAIEWGISAYAVANKSYSVNDQIAFESQLIQAVILKRAPIKGRFVYRFEGQGNDRVCFASVTLADGTGMVEYESPKFKDIQPKNSPLWKNDPDQQHCYYSGRALCRRHFPDVLLGIYDDDELPPAIGADRARDVTPPRGLGARLDALAGAPSPGGDHEGVAENSSGAEGIVDGDSEMGGATEAAKVADKPTPEKIALLEKLRAKATKGTAALRRALGSISEAEDALLTDADHDALGALAEAADRETTEQ